MKLATVVVAGIGLAAAAAGPGGFEGCFIPGEVSEYKVSWMGIPLAWSKTTAERIEEEGRELVRIRMVAQTYRAYTHIYEVDDVTEVVVDPATALPVRLDLTMQEGGRRKSHFTTFHHDRGFAVFHDRLAGTTNQVAIAPDTRDILAFLYAARAADLDGLAATAHRIYVDGKVYELSLSAGKGEAVRLPAYGKVASLPFEPVAEFDGLFLRQGRIVFWVSAQDPRVVTLVQAKVPVGRINVRLQKVSGTGNAFWDAADGEAGDG